MITVLGMDPGTNNFAYSVIQFKKDGSAYRIVEKGMIKNPIKEMNGFGVGKDMVKFLAEIRSLKRKHKADFAIAERFMTRGHGGTTIEAISAMLGIVGTVFGTQVCFISAAIWKNAWNKHYDLKGFYGELQPYGIPTHVIDAVSIGLYGATSLLDVPHFGFLSNIKQFKQRMLASK